MHEEALRDVESGVRVWDGCLVEAACLQLSHRITLTMQALKVPGMVAGQRAVKQLRIVDTDVSASVACMHLPQVASTSGAFDT